MGVDALMSISTSQPLSSDLVREASWKICATFGLNWFFVEPGRRAIHSADPRSAPRLYSPAIVRPDREYLVSIYDRYASLDYTTRQDLLDGYAEIAWWLEREIPGCRVWYGDDSSYALYPFGRRERAKIYHHQLRLGHHLRDIPLTRGRCFCKFCNHNLEILYAGEGYQLERCLGCAGSVLFKGDEALPRERVHAIKKNEPHGLKSPRLVTKALHELLYSCYFDADMIVY